MKNILYIILIISLHSCTKNDFGSYKEVPPVESTDTTDWTKQYSDQGVLNTNPIGGNNELVGTKWVITKYNNGFMNTFPNDTIEYIDNSHYRLNGGAQRTYTLTTLSGSTNKSLTLNFLATLGGSLYSGQVGYYFISDGFISNGEFTDLQYTSKIYKVWMVKL